MRRGFGIINAIIILVLIATLMTVVVKVSFISVKHTSDTYLIERAKLFMQSAVENAVMAIEGYKRNNANKCLRKMHFVDEDGMFEANITVLRYYCYDLKDCPCGGDLVKKTDTDMSHGYVLLDVIIDSNMSNPRINKRIIIQRTTLQRP